MISRAFIITLILLVPTQLSAQQGRSLPKDIPDEVRVLAPQELEAIIVDADTLQDKNAFVKIRSRAAMLVSFSDPPRSESMFLKIWKFANEQTDESFDKDQARLEVLKYLLSRNPKLGRRLLAEQAKAETSSPQRRTPAGDDNSRLGTKLAFQLADTDPSMAASLLETSLSNSPTPAAMGALLRLREKDSILSDYVVAQALERLTIQPTLVSLPELFLLTAYVFPGPDAPLNSMDAEASLQRLQLKYFLAGY